MMTEQSLKYRYFKVSVSFFFFSFYGNSRVITIKNNFYLVLWASWYSLIALLFGWWGGNIFKPLQGIQNTLEALHINLSGGIDFTNELTETDYDEKHNHIWRNLYRSTSEKISREELEIIIELQNVYEKFGLENFNKDNVIFLIEKLDQIGIEITETEIKDFFEALESYNNIKVE